MGTPWKQRNLGDLVEIKDSARIPNKEWTTSGIPYIRASDVSNENLTGVLFISSEKYEYYKTRTGAPSRGDVLFNGGGDIGKALLVKECSPIYVQGGAILYAKTSESSHLTGEYLKTYFETELAQNYIESASAGGTIKHFTLKPSQKMPILFPNITEQQQIGELFQQFNGLITLHQKQLDLLKEQKKGLLQKMFPKDGSNIPELRFPEFTSPWEQRKLGMLIKTKSFKEYIKEPSLIGAYPVIQQGEVPIAGLANGIPIKDFENYILFGDHTLSLYKPQSPFFVASDGLKIIYNSNFEIDFLYALLQRYKPQSEGYKRHFSILKDILGSYSSDLSEQRQIGSFFSNFDNLITLHQHQLDLLKEQKKGFLQKMFPKEGRDMPELRFPKFR